LPPAGPSPTTTLAGIPAAVEEDIEFHARIIVGLLPPLSFDSPGAAKPGDDTEKRAELGIAL